MPPILLNWSSLALPLIAAFFWIYGPGLLVGPSLRLTGIKLWGLAPLISTAILSGIAIVFPSFGISWRLLPVSIAIVGIAVVCAARPSVWKNFHVHPRQAFTPRSLVLAIAALVTAIGISARLIYGIQIPGAYSQTFDGAFHVNVTQWIAERADASSLHMDIVPDHPNFYPAAFHAFTSLVTLTTGCPIPLTINATVLIIAALVWPGSIALLVDMLRPLNTTETAASFLFSTIFSQFPFLFAYYGVLYPNFLAYALLPASFAVLIGLLFHKVNKRNWEVLALLPLAFVALALSQPNALFLFILVAAPVLIYWAWVSFPQLAIRQKSPRIKVLASLLLTLLIAVAYYAVDKITLIPGSQLAKMRTTENDWQPQGDKWEGLWRLLTFNVGVEISSDTLLWSGVILAILTAIGAAVSLTRPRYRFLPFCYAVLGFLALAAFALDFPQRAHVIGLWYSDSQRLYGALPILAVPLTTIGFIAAVNSGMSLLSKRIRPSARFKVTGALTLLFVVLMSFSQGMTRVNQALQHYYSLPPVENDRTLLSQEEYELLLRIPNHVARQEGVMGDPWDGSSFVWAVSGRKAIYPQPGLQYPENSDQAFVAGHLRNVQSDPRVCEALGRLNSHYVLDFGTDLILWEGFVNGENNFYRGFENLDSAPGVQLVDEQGSARLYKVTACSADE